MEDHISNTKLEKGHHYYIQTRHKDIFSHFSNKACKRHLFDSELKKECWVQLKPSVGQSSKVCREDTIFYLFSPYFLCPFPNVDCKTVTLFLRIQGRRASSPKKGLMSSLSHYFPEKYTIKDHISNTKLEKGDHYYTEIRHKDLFSHYNLMLRKR